MTVALALEAGSDAAHVIRKLLHLFFATIFLFLQSIIAYLRDTEAALSCTYSRFEKFVFSHILLSIASPRNLQLRPYHMCTPLHLLHIPAQNLPLLPSPSRVFAFSLISIHVIGSDGDLVRIMQLPAPCVGVHGEMENHIMNCYAEDFHFRCRELLRGRGDGIRMLDNRIQNAHVRYRRSLFGVLRSARSCQGQPSARVHKYNMHNAKQASENVATHGAFLNASTTVPSTTGAHFTKSPCHSACSVNCACISLARVHTASTVSLSLSPSLRLLFDS